jgi:hypothetical protein
LTSKVRLALAASASAVLLLSVAGPAAAVAVGGWGTAIQVPGLAALNVRQRAAVDAMSCGASGDCLVGGFYTDSSASQQAFVDSETGGTWGQAIEVPGLAALNTGGDAAVNSVSCASAGNCVVGGSYSDSAGVPAFVDSETGGIWGQPIQVPGTSALSNIGFVAVDLVSCPRADVSDCALAGEVTTRVNGKFRFQAFVDSETGGTWGQAEKVPGIGQSPGYGALDSSLSCPAAGGCLLTGQFGGTAFTVTETNGVWGRSQTIPGLSALDAGRHESASAGSCSSMADCSVGGYYTDSAGHRQAYVVTKHNGVWGKAQEVLGTAALNAGGLAQLSSVDCTSAGTCSAVGGYATASGSQEPFVVSQVGGTWGQASTVPGIANVDKGHGSALTGVSCKSAGNCAAVGSYSTAASVFITRALVVDQSGGVWQRAEQVPGTAALDGKTTGAVTAVSCALAGACSLGGNYSNGPTGAFVDSQG